MEDVKSKVEAVLFMTGRAMSVEEIAQFCNLGSVGVVKDALRALTGEYGARESGLEVIEREGKYQLSIRRIYTSLTTKLVTSCELDTPTQATLALIAYKQPVHQSEIIKMRGNSAYDHIHLLRDQEFVTAEKQGRTRLLKLAPKFYDYFDVVEETLKQKLREVAKPEEIRREEPKVQVQTTIDPVSPPVSHIEKEEPKPDPEQKKRKPEATPFVEAPKEVLLAKERIPQDLDADDFGTPM